MEEQQPDPHEHILEKIDSPSSVSIMALSGLLVSCIGIIGFIFYPAVGIICALAGLAVSIIGLVQIRRDPDSHHGKGLAIAGIVISGLVILAVIVALLLAYATPTFA